MKNIKMARDVRNWKQNKYKIFDKNSTKIYFLYIFIIYFRDKKC